MNKIHTFPIQKQTVDARTGKVTSTEAVNAQILPAPHDTCPECATAHEPELPHNAQSIYYQYAFYGREGRWPTWTDAMAHCPQHIRELWIQELTARGVSVNGEYGGAA
ncbi:hypothetical protein MKU92_000055 [Salmonella enterica]|nr:hypothetical protein [Salmonella enterica subsp. enterica]EHW9181139.1 hypothetical protein [Salmonella enterica subsp. enterica]EIX6431238.1 hypothetical protein [Salmonella enterica]